MIDKSTDQLYEEYVVLLRKLNRKQDKIIHRLREELAASNDRAEHFSRLYGETADLLVKTRKDMAGQNEQMKDLKDVISRLKLQITEESSARLAAVKAEMAEQNQRIQELAREKFERDLQRG